MSSYTESVFVDKFGWGEDWQADHSQVVELIDITHLTMGVIHLLVTILRCSGLNNRIPEQKCVTFEGVQDER